MSPEYFMRTTRIGFGRWTAEDFDVAMGLWGDARVTGLIGGPFSEQQVRDRLAREIANQAAYGIQYWPLFHLSDGAPVGCCGLRPYPTDADLLEIGFHLRFDHWGQGYAEEAARSVIEYAFTILNVGGLFAGHHPENATSRKLLGRLGFRYTHDAFYTPTGLYHLSYVLTCVDSCQPGCQRVCQCDDGV